MGLWNCAEVSGDGNWRRKERYGQCSASDSGFFLLGKKMEIGRAHV